jgi:hypothetical protein
VPNYSWASAAPCGLADLSLGFKQQVGAPGDVDLSAIVAVSFPAGASSQPAQLIDMHFGIGYSFRFDRVWR